MKMHFSVSKHYPQSRSQHGEGLEMRRKADGTVRGHRGGTGRERRCFIAVSARGVCQIVSAVKTGRITFRESLKGTDGRAGEKVTSANSGEEPCGLRGCRAARCPGKAGWLYVFGIAREN